MPLVGEMASSCQAAAGAEGAAASQLCLALLDVNHLAPADVVAAVIAASPDLDAGSALPALRERGIAGVPIFAARDPRLAPGTLEARLFVRLRRQRRLKPLPGGG